VPLQAITMPITTFPHDHPPGSQAGDDREEGHVPTLPFGTKFAVVSAPTSKGSRVEKESGARFRFLVPTLPTSLKLESEQQRAATLASQHADSGHVARPNALAPRSRIRLPLVLGVTGVAVLAFLLLIWPDNSDAPKQASPADRLPSALSRLPGGHAEPRTVEIQGEPPAQIKEPRNAASVQAGTSPPLPHASPPANNIPRAAPNPAARSASVPATRATPPKALTTLDGESVLASVLAPPPAD